MLVYDDMQPSEKLLIYDRGVSMHAWSEREDVYSQLVSVPVRRHAGAAPR